MKRRVFCLLIAALLLCTACGGEAVPTGTPTTQPHQTTLPPATEISAPPTTAPVETTSPILWEDTIHSGLSADGSFGPGTVFIGDSLTVGLVCQQLMPEKLIGNAKYMAKTGAPLRSFLSHSYLMEEENSVYSWEFLERSYMESIAMVGDSARAIYFMLGTNFDIDNNAESYINAVEYLLKVCPNATIYMQTIPYSSSDQVHWEEVNRSIQEAYQHFSRQNIQRVMVIDTHEGIGDSTAADGVHLTVEGYRLWYETIVRFAEENQIPQ